jgi:hypothetical protein
MSDAMKPTRHALDAPQGEIPMPAEPDGAPAVLRVVTIVSTSSRGRIVAVRPTSLMRVVRVVGVR